MKYAFVFSPTDFNELQTSTFNSFQGEIILCSSLRDVQNLKQADVVYFVVSKFSMCSTAYQELIGETFLLTEEKIQRLLRLDEALIPLGFRVLNDLPLQEDN